MLVVLCFRMRRAGFPIQVPSAALKIREGIVLALGLVLSFGPQMQCMPRYLNPLYFSSTAVLRAMQCL